MPVEKSDIVKIVKEALSLDVENIWRERLFATGYGQFAVRVPTLGDLCLVVDHKPDSLAPTVAYGPKLRKNGFPVGRLLACDLQGDRWPFCWVLTEKPKGRPLRQVLPFIGDDALVRLAQDIAHTQYRLGDVLDRRMYGFFVQEETGQRQVMLFESFMAFIYDVIGQIEDMGALHPNALGVLSTTAGRFSGELAYVRGKVVNLSWDCEHIFIGANKITGLDGYKNLFYGDPLMWLAALRVDLATRAPSEMRLFNAIAAHMELDERQLWYLEFYTALRAIPALSEVVGSEKKALRNFLDVIFRSLSRRINKSAEKNSIFS